MVSRRHTMLAGGTVLLTSLGLSTIPDRSSGVELTGSFDVSDEEAQVTEVVNKARLDVRGSFAWESDTAPTKAILRVEISRSGSFEQLEAIQYQNELTRSDSREFDIQCNLLDHSSITAVDLSPSSVGESKSLNLSGRITIELITDGRTLATERYDSTFAVKATKTLGATSLEFGATGDVTIS